MPVIAKVTPSAATPPKAARDRSPSFPFIPLKTAIERLEAFEKKFGRHPTPALKAGLAWGMKEKSSQSDQTLAALKSFGLVKYDGTGPARSVSLTEEGRNYLRARQDSIKKEILKVCALRPKIMRKFWASWQADRPPDEVALDQLVMKEHFSDAGARAFLKIYDETIRLAGLSAFDKMPDPGDEPDDADGESDDNGDDNPPPPPPLPPSGKGKVQVMAGERELTTGLLSKEANFRLLVSGPVGVKEIERLIKKLELDKEILADADDGPSDDDFADMHGEK
jgi:hypothetical protein